LGDDPRFDHNFLFFNNFLYNLCDWFDFDCFGIDVYRDCAFDVDGDWYFDGFEDDSIHELYISFLDGNCDYLVDVDRHRYFLPFNYHSFFDYLLHLHACARLEVFHEDLVARDLDCSIDVEIHDALSVDLDWSLDEEVLGDVVLNGRHFDGYLDYFFNDFLYDLRHLHDFLYDSRYDHNFLHNFLYFNALWYFHYLLDDFFLCCWHFLDSFQVYFLWDYFFFPDEYWHLFLHDERHIFYDLHWFFFCEDDVFEDLDGDVFFHLYGLHEGDLMYFSFDPRLGDYHGHLYVLLYLSYLHLCLVDYSGNLNFHYLYFLHDFEHLANDLYFPGR